MWFTVTDRTSDADRYVLRDVVLAIYWDDEKRPSVECPLGDFFCCGFGQSCDVFSEPIVVAPTRGMNCYFTMPFRKRARIVVRNDHAHAIPALFYQIDLHWVMRIPPVKWLISMRNGADSQSLL